MEAGEPRGAGGGRERGRPRGGWSPLCCGERLGMGASAVLGLVRPVEDLAPLPLSPRASHSWGGPCSPDAPQASRGRLGGARRPQDAAARGGVGRGGGRGGGGSTGSPGTCKRPLVERSRPAGASAAGFALPVFQSRHGPSMARVSAAPGERAYLESPSRFDLPSAQQIRSLRG